MTPSITSLPLPRFDVLRAGRALGALLRDPDLRATLARRAHEGVRAHYTVAQMARQTLDVFARQRVVAAAV